MALPSTERGFEDVRSRPGGFSFRRLFQDRRPTVAEAMVGALAVLYVIILVRTAWVCDDAFISLRTVDNFVRGYGLRWNVDERVQAFTHPLWLVIVSGFYAVTREPYFTVLAVSMGMSLAAVWIYARHIAADASTTAVGLLLLVFSKSFMDYSTSGLENPLTHLLVATFFAIALAGEESSPRRLLALSFVTGLLAVDRLDAVMLVAPIVALRAWRVGLRRSARALALGALPFVGWELFSIVYYGLPFPNTAYAKLGGDVLRSERFEQGIFYVIDAFSMDPLTPVVIGLAITVAFALRDRQGIAAALGMLLSVIYVIAIGGDFMSGRMFSSTFFMAVFMLTRQQWAFEPRLLAVPVMLAIMLGTGATNPGILTGKDFRHDQTDRDGIVDERRVYFPYTGLLNVMSTGNALTHPWADEGRRLVSEGRRVAISGATGFFGFAIGGQAHVIDRFALGDAFLARLPAEAGWNVGHLTRRLPGGYEETIATGRNVIVEPGVAALYDRIALLTRAPLFSIRRLHAIWRLQIDGYSDLLEKTSYGLITIRAEELARGASLLAQGIRVHERGVLVRFDGQLRGADLEVMADGNDDFFLFYQLGDKTVGGVVVHRAWPAEPSTPHTRRLLAPSADLLFDRILIRPRKTWGPMSLWGVRPCL